MKTLIPLVMAALALTAPAADNLTAPQSSQSAAVPAVTKLASLEAVQAEYLKRFVESPGFGASRILRPRFNLPVQLVLSGTAWQVPPPQLIGLEDAPLVYLHNGSGPSKADLSDHALRKLLGRRPLTATETNLVAALRAGANLALATNRVEVVEEGRSLVREEWLALGALRAGRDCAACHQCEQGRLLGAFTYTFTLIEMPEAATNAPPLRGRQLLSAAGSRPPQP